MAIRLTESRLRQIIREEAAKLTRPQVRGVTQRLREANAAGQKYLSTIMQNADDQEFFAGDAKESVAKNIVEDTLAYDFSKTGSPKMVDTLVKALMAKHKDLSDKGYEGLGGGESNDDSSY